MLGRQARTPRRGRPCRSWSSREPRSSTSSESSPAQTSSLTLRSLRSERLLRPVAAEALRADRAGRDIGRRPRRSPNRGATAGRGAPARAPSRPGWARGLWKARNSHLPSGDRAIASKPRLSCRRAGDGGKTRFHRIGGAVERRCLPAPAASSTRPSGSSRTSDGPNSSLDPEAAVRQARRCPRCRGPTGRAAAARRRGRRRARSACAALPGPAARKPAGPRNRRFEGCAPARPGRPPTRSSAMAGPRSRRGMILAPSSLAQGLEPVEAVELHRRPSP